MDRNLALEFVRVTEVAAIAAAAWIGRGDKHAADQAAVDEMRSRFNDVHFSGEVVIGEGEKDKAPQLYVGEKLGSGETSFDIAVDPLECTDSVASGSSNAITVIATGAEGALFKAPDMYMDKIAVGPKAKGVIDLKSSVEENLSRIAHALEKEISELVVIVLDRPRHKTLIADIRSAGARVRLITDG
ncbi:MAG: fructose-bisphosphatase class II, partial [Candidatus Magasanikbacteria bacterium]|nr:fructose-bisphosphatase class II [Candidatus Magasanikbacteria bacterium]